MNDIPSRARPSPKASTPRFTKKTKVVNFRMPVDDLIELDSIAKASHLKRTQLILQGLRRCVKDKAWYPSGPMPRGVDLVSPPPEVVVLSETLLALALSFETAFAGRKSLPKPLKEAEATIADAKRMLAQLLEDLGCS